MDENLFSKIMVELNDGTIVNITDLPKEQYEQFLELMLEVSITYFPAMSREYSKN